MKNISKIIIIFIAIIGLVAISINISSAKNKHNKKPNKINIAKLPTATNTPAPKISQEPVKLAATSTASKPADILNLTNWKLTLPTGSSGHPTEILQPQLATFTIDPWFVINSQKDAVLFRAPVNGVTTSGSKYPRSELREMTNNGKTNASWSSTSGKHTMFYEAAVTAVPQVKRHVVVGQIHDASDDIMVIRLELPKLYVNVDGKNIKVLDENYTAGKKFTIKFVSENGQTKVYYNNQTDPIYILSKSFSGAYFKVGAYTQSNCSKEGVLNCNNNDYGEVAVYQVNITHE